MIKTDDVLDMASDYVQQELTGAFMRLNASYKQLMSEYWLWQVDPNFIEYLATTTSFNDGHLKRNFQWEL